MTAVRDMVLTSPYGDCCPACMRDSADDELTDITWPYAATRNGDYIRGRYACPRGHEWTCSYLIDIAAMFG